MKRIYIYFSLLAFLVITSCNDITDYNEDTKKAESVDPIYLFSYATENLARQWGDLDYNVNVDKLWSNTLTQTTYTDECQYDPTQRDVAGYIWDNIYTEVLAELYEAKSLLEEEDVASSLQSQKINQLAIVNILQVFSYQYLVDNFGDIPYSEAMDVDNTTPAYDDAATIYSAIADTLISALSSIDVTADGFDSSGDLIFAGDVSAWKKFGASLLLKIGMRLSDENSTLASTLVNDAVTYGVFESNDDNAIFEFISATSPYYSPWYDFCYGSSTRYSDFIAPDVFMDILQDNNDPRISSYFDTVDGEYKSAVYGATGNSYSSYSHISSNIISSDGVDTYEGVLMDYASVSFFLAEAVERGFISTGTTAETYYINGITASFDYWGRTTDELNAYLTGSNVVYSSADYKMKIGLQKYIAAAFIMGHEGWTEAKRLDYPELAVAAGNNVANPKRMIYPADESLINGTNYDAASSAIGGDELSTALFWDVE